MTLKRFICSIALAMCALTFSSAQAEDFVPLKQEAETGAQGDYGRTMLILDGSGSMWGQVDGKHKITIARETFDKVLEDWPKDASLGFMSYGHREKANCGDIEVILPSTNMSVKDVMKAGKAINPKGKTPITDALVMAAEELKYTENKATVILISDGIETCERDPCAAAKKLEELGVNFTAHVIGFDLSDEDQKALQCVADNTGGQFLAASNAEELEVSFEEIQQEITSSVAEPMEVEEVIPEENNTQFLAIYEPNTPPTEDQLRWLVYKRGEAFTPENLVESTYATSPEINLEPGEYTVVIRGKGNVYSVQNAEIKEGRNEITFLLSTGDVHVDFVLAEGQEPIKRSIVWEVSRVVVDENGNAAEEKIDAGGYTNAVNTKLMAGRYVFYAQVDDFKEDRRFKTTVDVKPNDETSATIVANLGMLKITPDASAESEYDWRYSSWELYPADVGDSLTPERILHKLTPGKEAYVTPGTYVVVGRSFKKKEVRTQATVTAGEKTDLDIKVQ